MKTKPSINLLILVALSFFAGMPDANAQEPLPLLTIAPLAIAPATTVATFPVKTFLENIVVDKQGILFFTSLEEGKIYRLAPDGKPTVFAHIEGQVAGIALGSDGDLFADGWASDKAATIWHVTAKGEVSRVVSPPEALFFNGFIPLQGSRYLIADSFLGAVWEFDAKTGKAEIWIKDPLLARSDTKIAYPAVNGLHIYKNVLYLTNTQQRLLLRVPLTKEGKPATPPTVFVKDINLDDFAIGKNGTIYATTHIYNSVVQITPDGKVTTIAEAKQGVFGSTSAAFGRGKKDKMSLYVTTNGGMSLPPPEGIQPAQIVRLEIRP